MPAALQALDELLAGSLGEARDLHLLPDQEIDPLVHVVLIGAEVHAEGLFGAGLHLAHRLLELLQRHRGGGEDPEPAGRARGGGEARAGDPAHSGLDDRVLARRRDRRCACARAVFVWSWALRRAPCAFVPACRIEHFANESSAPRPSACASRGRGRDGRSGSRCSSRRRPRLTPGCTESSRSRDRVGLASRQSKTHEVRHDAANLVEARASAPSASARS